MYRIFTKEKRPQEIFNVNLTREEVEENNIDIWVDHKELNKDNYIVVYNDNFDYPILDNGVIREMTRDEKVENDIEVYLEEGEIIKDKKIIVIPCPTNLYRPIWNVDKWEEGANKIDLLKEKSKKVLKLKEIKKEIITLEEVKAIDEELADDEMIDIYKDDYKKLKKEILDLNKIIKSL